MEAEIWRPLQIREWEGVASLAFDTLQGVPMLLLQCPLRGLGVAGSWTRVRVEWVGLFDPKMRLEAVPRCGAW